MLLIEIKYHKIKHGRLGTGHGKGGGFQPEVLAKQPYYFKANMRWIIGTEEREGYILITNEELVDYISGGVIGEKYNNIQNKIFQMGTLLTEEELIRHLREWLLE